MYYPNANTFSLFTNITLTFTPQTPNIQLTSTAQASIINGTLPTIQLINVTISTPNITIPQIPPINITVPQINITPLTINTSINW
ncbi:hypothetical protein JCM16161A_10740 [Vulcanisaeta sp. JCM 16161]|uniref:hypothetical protein n=1 Tax=Vulcanisaeta sp. JCM 16161 TaxID=1295372 RepID=UPI0006D12ECD|nr:hypothetical protein [Vulcanisaeta sp. JCM 16161]